MIYFAIFTGCLFIIVLSVYILKTLKAQKAKASAQQEVIDQHLKEHTQRQEYVTSSINIIIKALDASQIEVVEASIRLKVLVDQLRPSVPENSFPNIEHVFSQTQHIPKLKKWKELDKAQRKQYGKDMKALEEDFSLLVKAEIKLLAQMMEQR